MSMALLFLMHAYRSTLALLIWILRAPQRFLWENHVFVDFSSELMLFEPWLTSMFEWLFFASIYHIKSIICRNVL